MPVAIDRSGYLSIPRGSCARTLTLARVLRGNTPTAPSVDLVARTARLDERIEVTSAAMRARHVAVGESTLAAETELDGFVDALLFVCRDRLQHWQVLGRPAAQRLARHQVAEQLGGHDYAAGIDKAHEAARVLERLFANDLDANTRQPYMDQLAYLRTIEGVIEHEQLDASLAALVGVEFRATLRDAIEHYAQMVKDRVYRDPSAINLRELTAELHQAIQDYVIALLAMIRDDDPDNVAQLRRALAPVDGLREQYRIERSRNAAEPADDADASTDPVHLAAVEELLADEQELAVELGLIPEPESDAQSAES